MFSRGYSAKASVICRRRGETMSAPMPETFSWERARTENVGVAPHGAQVRRSTGIIRKPVSSRQIRWARRRPSFFYPGPVLVNPLAHAAIVALLRARLGALRTEAAGPQQSSDMIRMVGDLEVAPDDVDDPPARPQARGVAGGFRPRHDQARQLPPLRGRQFGRTTRRRAGLRTMRSLPSTHGASIDTQALGDDMHREVTLEQVDRTEPSSLELGRTSLWAHAHLPQGSIGHYLCRSH